MPKITINLNDLEYERLKIKANRERRTVRAQAEWILIEELDFIPGRGGQRFELIPDDPSAVIATSDIRGSLSSQEGDSDPA